MMLKIQIKMESSDTKCAEVIRQQLKSDLAITKNVNS